MDHRSFFLNTLYDIREKLKREKYHHIRACGLLRHLFLDETPLLHIVNRDYKIPILFHVSDYKTKMPIKTNFHWRGLEPITLTTHKVKLNEFLKIEMLVYKNFNYTVKDIIYSACHIMGGIHSQKAKDDKEVNFLDLDKVIPIQADISLISIKSICNISLEAMKQLEEKLK